MSDVLVPFLFELRRRKLKVGPTELLAVARALALGLHEESLDGFYYVSRALIVHREADLDPFDEAFSAHFRGIVQAREALLKDLEEWLRDPAKLLYLTDEEKRLLESLDVEELRRLFEERMRQQNERHEGGNRWIGTGGTSPFGTGGFHPSGLRVGGGGGRSALGVADARKYKPYRSDVVLDARQIEVALRKLRAFTREGGEEELDIEETIDATARNAGELEIVTRPPRRSNVRVVLLMDVGGSMDPHVELVSRLFSAAKRASNFRELRTFYFHNAIYGRVYATERFEEPTRLVDLFEQIDDRWKVVLVGDAAMHPGELLGTGPWDLAQRDSAYRDVNGLGWFAMIAERFPRTAWLNPEPPHYWKGGTADLIRAVVPMFQLTLDGLSEAIAHLSKGSTGRRG